MKKTMSVLASALCLLCSTHAHAALYKLDFEATDFIDTIDGTPASVDAVHGSILFSAASLVAPIDAIEAVNLVIGKHTYTKNEIGVIDYGDGNYLFGAVLNDVNSMQGGTDDFQLYAPSGTGKSAFVYAAPEESGKIWLSTPLTIAYTEQIADVPEPTSFALLLAGVGSLIGLRRRRRA